ncbi:MAG: c-type cytochrome [Woeseiaceae bacterium]
MFMRNIAVVVLLLVSVAAAAQESPGLGQQVSVAEIEALDFTVQPDGAGLPDGAGSAKQGAIVYQTHCLACHGPEGQDGINDRLAGGHGSLTTSTPVKTLGSFWPYATTVFDYVRRAMPYQTPGVLTNDELYAVTAYLLFVNDIVEEKAVMNAQTLPGVRMPNRDNFVWDYPSKD